MDATFITKVLLPVALAIIMLGLGLALTFADFRRVVQEPKAVLIGLGCQMLILPVVAFVLAKAFALPPELAVGLMLLAASPGGPTANLYSHLARGDVALNITLTAVNSLLSLLTLPFIVNYSLRAFMGESTTIGLQFGKIVQVFAIVLIPVAIGMLIHAKAPALSARLAKPVRILSAIFLLLVIGLTIFSVRQNFLSWFVLVGLAALLFNLVSMAVGYFVPAIVGVPEKQRVSIGMEIGIHNGTLAIAIASGLLMRPAMSVPAVVYSIIMFFTAAAFGYFVARRLRTAES